MAPRVQESALEGPRVIGRYALHDEIAAGGMATVHLGRLIGQAGFSRIVAIKRLHAQYAKDPDFVSMFMDEARVAARIRHPNVAGTLDVVARDGELFLVMEYIQGESLAALLRRAALDQEPIDPRIGAAIVVGLLHGLHAAHEARNERGEPLELVHRDVSPQNVIVGIDGIPRVVDFGIAKAVGRVQTTRDGELKGKLSYMSPEQVQGQPVTRRTDIYAASIVLWEVLTGKRLLARENDAAVMLAALTATAAAPSTLAPRIAESLDRITLRGLSHSPDKRFQTAEDMALALEQALDLAMPSEIGAWVQRTAKGTLTERALRVANVENASGGDIQFRSSTPPAQEPSRTLMAASSPKVVTSAGPASRGKLGMTLLLPILAVGVVALAAFARFATPPSTAHASPQAPTTAPADPPAAVRPSLPEPSPPSLAAVPFDSLPSATPSAAPSAPSSGAATAASDSSRARSPAAATHGSSAPPAAKHGTNAPNCDPPFRVDPTGRKIFKLECL